MTHTPFVSNPCPATAIVFVSQNLFYGQLPHRAFALLSVEAAAKQLAQHRKERAAIKIAAVKHGVKSSSILECASIKTGGILPFLPPDCKCNDCQHAQSALSLAS